MRAIRPKEEPSASPTTSPNIAPPFSDAGSDARDSNKRRKCISSACLPCRKRKSKCDGSTPFCSTCTAVYKTVCEYDVDSDHRRKAALKRDIQALQGLNGSWAVIAATFRSGNDGEISDVVHALRNGEEPESIAEGLRREQGSGEESDVKNVEGALSMDEKGVKRHFGHTSNLGLVTHQEYPMLNQSKTEEWTTVTRDSELVNHLLHLFFCWVHPYYGTFSRDAFYMSMHEGSTTYCSPLLMNAILAVACHYSDRLDVRANLEDPVTAGDRFFDEAKWLLFKDESSCLTTVQALSVMSVRGILAGRDSSGYAYIARAAHMALELGLHLKLEGSAHNMSPTESEVRKITFWSLFHYETCWAIALGRPTQLPNYAINVDRPSVVEQYDNQAWYPYTDGYNTANGPGAGQACVESSFQDQIYSLSEIINDMVVAFYAPRERFTSRKLLELYKRYQSWYENLPSVLALRQTTLPHVLCLHFYYHTCLIHLFRAFIKVTLIRSTVSPRTVCTNAAGEIGRLFAVYRHTYSLRRSSIICSHVILTSAIIDLVNLPHNNTFAVNLAQAIEIMREASINNMFFTRDLVVLLALAKQWSITLPPPVEHAAFSMRADLPPPNNRPIQSSAYIPTNSAFHFFPPQPHTAPTSGAPEIQYYTDPPVSIPPLNPPHNAQSSTPSSHPLQHPYQQQQHQHPSRQPSDNNNPNIHPNNNNINHTTTTTTTTTNNNPNTINHPNQFPTLTPTTTTTNNTALFWSPFPDQGLPLQTNVAHRGSTMDIARVVDDMGAWDQLSRDGFKMAEGDAEWGFATAHEGQNGAGGDTSPNGVGGFGMGMGVGWTG